jgi:hypothetical protein
VLILDGLGKDDYQTGENLFQALEAMDKPSTLCRHIKIGSRADLFEILDEIVRQCGSGLRPIIHFEVHGGPTEGIGLGDSGETASWPELCAYFQRINVLTENNLGVVMAACFGLYAVKEVSIKKPAPFHFLIGSQEEVYVDVIDAQMKEFYRTMFRTGLLEEAMDEVDKTFQQFHVEKYFAISYGKYIKNGLTGTGRTERIDRLVAQALAEKGLPHTEENAAPLLIVLEERMKPTPENFKKWADVFMVGRYSLSYEALLEWATQPKEES